MILISPKKLILQIGTYHPAQPVSHDMYQVITRRKSLASCRVKIPVKSQQVDRLVIHFDHIRYIDGFYGGDWLDLIYISVSVESHQEWHGLARLAFVLLSLEAFQRHEISDQHMSIKKVYKIDNCASKVHLAFP